MKNNKADVGRRLRSARMRKGLTQEQVVEHAGRSVTQISRIERGKGLPSLELLVVLCNLYGVSSTQILCGVIEKDKTTLVKETESELAKCEREEILFVEKMIDTFRKGK